MRFLSQPHIPLATVMNFPMHHSDWPALFITLQRGIAAKVRFIRKKIRFALTYRKYRTNPMCWNFREH